MRRSGLRHTHTGMPASVVNFQLVSSRSATQVGQAPNYSHFRANTGGVAMGKLFPELQPSEPSLSGRVMPQDPTERKDLLSVK